MKKVKEMMATTIQSCTTDEPIKKVSVQMRESNIGFLPVLDNSQKVIGTITDRDIALAIGKTSKTMEELKVKDAMNSSVHAIHEDDDATEALELMKTKQIGRLPVVDDENKLKGVLNLSRIARKSNEGTQDGKEKVMETVYSLADRSKNKGMQK